jgi:superfamily II DNA or RNA helicase
MTFPAGSLVHARGRDWVVLPSRDVNLLLLKPVDGTDEEVAGIYLPLGLEGEITPTEFKPPTADDVGDFASARLLYNALRLSFRSGTGPFRSLGKLSFRPRGYQLVPLIMALRQAEDPLRLMIADDVGVGKTIEALLIVRELLDRRDIERFAVLCPPHLCDQWQYELATKFSIDAVVVRSNTQARLDRGIRGDASVYRYYPYQVISIDYIKGEAHRRLFLNECPELVLVDEVHSCARPAGASDSQQQRYRLIKEIAAKPGQGLVLLTATPHSGKTDEFRSLLGLLDPAYETWDLLATGDRERRELAVHYVQRRRRDVELWQGRHSAERTPFPRREPVDVAYTLDRDYRAFYDRLLAFCRGVLARAPGATSGDRIRYWSALTLLRGAMSSPAAGVEMLRARSQRDEGEVEAIDVMENPLWDRGEPGAADAATGPLLTRTQWTRAEAAAIGELADALSNLVTLDRDAKARAALDTVSAWVRDGFAPVVFCRFIATANHLGSLLREALARDFPGIAVEVVTSEDPDDVRRARVEGMGASDRRVLIATDCLSEGINLQELFSAVLHYDLPWNPNRLEQREGRADRYGQTAPVVKVSLLYGADNPIDGVVLKVLLRKVREIRASTGISIPFAEDSLALMDAVMQAVLLSEPAPGGDADRQLELDLQAASTAVIEAGREVEAASRREQETRSIFAQRSLHPEEIEEDLAAIDDALGDPAAVERFTLETVQRLFGVPVRKSREARCHVINMVNLPAGLREELERGRILRGERRAGNRNEARIGFESPVPDGVLHLGRTHPFVEALGRNVLTGSLVRTRFASLGRVAAVRTSAVTAKTVLLLFRTRHVIEDLRRHTHLFSEEAVISGYEVGKGEAVVLEPRKARHMMESATVSSDLSVEARREVLGEELSRTIRLRHTWQTLAESQAEAHAESHERFRRALERRRSAARYHAVTPAVPMDLLAVFVLLPERGPA